MYGWRAKLGIEMPVDNTVVEPEMWAMVPNGVTIHSIRVEGKKELTGEERSQSMCQMGWENAYMLRGTDAIGYCCQHSSFAKGVGWDLEMVKKIEENSGKPATTAATAMVRSMKEMGIKKVGVVAPYSESANQVLSGFLEGNGIKVVKIASLPTVPGPMEIVKIPIAVTYRLAKEADSPEADGVFISSTDLTAVSILSALESDLKKTVISVNQAVLWDLLRLVGVCQPVKGFGSLLGRGLEG